MKRPSFWRQKRNFLFCTIGDIELVLLGLFVFDVPDGWLLRYELGDASYNVICYSPLHT
jgi:hypothetical protein